MQLAAILLLTTLFVFDSFAKHSFQTESSNNDDGTTEPNNCDAASPITQTPHFAKYSYSVERAKNEYIVKFERFLDKPTRRRELAEFMSAFAGSCNSGYVVLEKNRLFDALPSDFDVIRINGEFNLTPSTYHNGLISGVYEQRKVTRELINHDNGNADNEDNGNEPPYEDEDDELLEIEEQELEAAAAAAKKKKKKKQQKLKPKQHRKDRRIFRAIPRELIDELGARKLWNEAGVSGAHVKVAVLDTGLEASHPHFKNVRERIDWTDENNPDDRIGHGTFVCGLIASRNRECLGLAPDVDLYVFKVFARNQTSYTSWFLDAFNYALLKRIDVLNLSIGGPDFMDMPFVHKVWEITSKGIIMVSGIGNDGPLYGTLSNPADQLDIIGVGGINSDDQIAKFSSRGMTTWELPGGYGRVKPDLVTYCAQVRGSKMRSGCRTLSGTSVASPIVAGAVALLVSLRKLDPGKYETRINPGSVKQVLMASADRIDEANVFEQGAGKLNLVRAYNMMSRYEPQASLFPSYLDLTECPYFWPYCSQSLYANAMPVIFNLTILNGMHVDAVVSKKPEWHPASSEHYNFIKMNFTYSARIWPWSGYLAIRMAVSESAVEFSGVVEGRVTLEIESTIDERGTVSRSALELFVRVRIVPKPPRQQRLLWDQFHNLRYPPGYFPRDDLKMKTNPLDWNADHLHTNFKDMYQYLRNSGYYLEVLGENLNCFDASNYGALLIFDSEEEFDESEVRKVYKDVLNAGLSLIVFAEWYNTSVIREAKFYDDNSRRWWTPVTGGANVPALNNLLAPFGIGLGDRIYDGEFRIGEQHSAAFVSGTSIVMMPASETNYVIERELRDEGREFLAEASQSQQQQQSPQKTKITEKVAILGLVQTGHDASHDTSSGRVVVYGDTNCVDSSHIKSDCFWLLSAIIEYACHNLVFSGFKQSSAAHFRSRPELVVKSTLVDFVGHENKSSLLSNYSKIIQGKNDPKSLECAQIEWTRPSPQMQPPPPLFSDDESSFPSKNNFYKFLRFDKNAFTGRAGGFDEIVVEASGTANPPLDNGNDHQQRHVEGDDKNVVKHNDDDTFFSNFPFFAFLAVCFVLVYIFYKFVVVKKKRRYNHSSSHHQQSRKFSDKGKLNH